MTGTQTSKKIRVRELILCSLFAALIAAGAFIKIPIPVVPFTLQFLFTTLAGLLIGPIWGLVSVCVYLALGLIGIPIFAQGGGFGYVLQPSFGYLIGFAVGTFLTGLIAHRVPNPSYKRLFAACFSGLGVVYAFGMAYYWVISNYYLGEPFGLWPLFLWCFLLAVPGDIALCALSAVLGKRLIPILNKPSVSPDAS